MSEEHSQVMNVPFSFQQKMGTYRKTKIDVNCWAKLYKSGNPKAVVLSFVDADDKHIKVPDSFILNDITLDEKYPKIIKPMTNLFVLVCSNNYSFTYNEKHCKFILQWEMAGDYVWDKV